VDKDGQYLDTCISDTYRVILFYRYQFSILRIIVISCIRIDLACFSSIADTSISIQGSVLALYDVDGMIHCLRIFVRKWWYVWAVFLQWQF